MFYKTKESRDLTRYSKVGFCNVSLQGSLSTSKVLVRVLDITLPPMPGIVVDGGNTSASCSAPEPASFTWYE